MNEPADYGTLTATTELSFGAPIGIMMLDCVAPMIPGSVGNASTYSVPAKYRRLADLTVEAIYGPNAMDHVGRVIEVAQALEADGAKVISANCGFTARYQKHVQDAVSVPVCLSSLLLTQPLQAMLPTRQKLGILTASEQRISPEFLGHAGIPWDASRIAMGDLEFAPAFADAFIVNSGTADFAAIQDEVVREAVNMVKNDPTIGALLLECSELPPYAEVVQRATGLPVFDFSSMIEFFVGGLYRKPFLGPV